MARVLFGDEYVYIPESVEFIRMSYGSLVRIEEYFSEPNFFPEPDGPGHTISQPNYVKWDFEANPLHPWW